MSLNIIVTITVFTVMHLAIIILTIFRLGQRIFLYVLWADDFAIALSTIGNVLMVARLLSFALHRQSSEPVQFRIELVVYFWVVWLSRASTILASGRTRLESTRHVQASTVSAACCIAIGVLYGAIAAVLCTNDWGCIDATTCLCYPPQPLLVSALIMDVFFDIAIVVVNWKLLVQSTGFTFNALPSGRRLVVLGFCSNILILSIGTICFSIYIVYHEKNRMQLLYYINTHMIVAVFSANISVILGVIIRRFGLKGSQSTFLPSI